MTDSVGNSYIDFLERQFNEDAGASPSGSKAQGRAHEEAVVSRDDTRWQAAAQLLKPRTSFLFGVSAGDIKRAAELLSGTPQLQVPVSVTKRAFDILGAAGGLVSLAPLMIAVAILVKLDSKGPILFRQERVGRTGKTFYMYKFRTMIPSARSWSASLTDGPNSSGVLFKLARDPRVTRVGRVLRRMSIDELPQLMNVLQGDMSLVGPRPPLPQEVALYDEFAGRRLLVKPGITGLWQLSGHPA